MLPSLGFAHHHRNIQGFSPRSEKSLEQEEKPTHSCTTVRVRHVVSDNFWGSPVKTEQRCEGQLTGQGRVLYCPHLQTGLMLCEMGDTKSNTHPWKTGKPWKQTIFTTLFSSQDSGTKFLHPLLFFWKLIIDITAQSKQPPTEHGEKQRSVLHCSKPLIKKPEKPHQPIWVTGSHSLPCWEQHQSFASPHPLRNQFSLELPETTKYQWVAGHL